MTDLDRRLERFYATESGRRRVTHVGLRASRPWRDAVVAVAALLLVVGMIGLAREAAQPTQSPASASTAPSAPLGGGVRVDNRTTLTTPTTVCRIAAAGALLLTAMTDPRDQNGRCQLMVSPDAGITWRPSNTTAPVQSVAIAPRGDLFAGLADGTIMRAPADTQNWMSVYRLPTAASSPGIIRFAFSPTEMWAGGVGVLRSADGVHWDDITHGLGTLAADPRERPSFGVVGLVARQDGVVVAVSGNLPEAGVWRFTAGRGWDRIAPASLGQPLDLVASGSELVLLTQRGTLAPDRTSTPAAWHSFDDGATWRPIDYGTGSGAVLHAVTAFNGNLLAAAGGGLVRLEGSVWTAVPGWSSTDIDVRALATTESDLYAVAGPSLIRYHIVPSP